MTKWWASIPLNTKLWLSIAILLGIVILSFLWPHRDDSERRKLIGQAVLDEAVGGAKKSVPVSERQQRGFVERFWERLGQIFRA